MATGSSLVSVGEIRAGAQAEVTLSAGSCARIFTGASLPHAANTVVMQEYVEVLADGSLRLLEDVRRGQNVRLRGEDVRAGEVIVKRNSVVHVGVLALLSGLDLRSVLVQPKVRVSLLCTGDEVRAPGSEGRPSSIADAVSAPLTQWVRALGGHFLETSYVADDAEATGRALEGALSQADLVITVGGASVGSYDHVARAVRGLGGDFLFESVNLKPGKPVKVASCKGRWVLCLPGNPVSALVCFGLLGRVLLGRLGARSVAKCERPMGYSMLAHRTEAHLGYLRDGVIHRLARQSSGSLVLLAQSEGFCVLPERHDSYQAGDRVEWIPWPSENE